MHSLKVNVVVGVVLMAVAVNAGFHEAEYQHIPSHGYELSSQGHHDLHHDYYAPPHYQFEYKVQDPHTGDVKSHEESRIGDKVKGHYTQHQPDGTILVVHYTADKHNGYNAHVQKLGMSIHPQPQHHYHQHDSHHHF